MVEHNIFRHHEGDQALIDKFEIVLGNSESFKNNFLPFIIIF